MGEDKKFIVLEIQQQDDGTVANLTSSFTDLASAESTFYSILASAALSSVHIHTAVLLDTTGFVYQYKGYVRPLPDPEPAPEPESESESNN